MSRLLEKPENIGASGTQNAWQQATEEEKRIPLLTPEEEKRISNFRSLKVHVECAETFIRLAQKSAKKTYPGHFLSMMEDISEAVDSAVNALKVDNEGVVGADHFVANVIDGIRQAREMGYPNRVHEESWAKLSREIDGHIGSLRTVVREIKMQRSAPDSELAHRM
ncbi:MAG: hypothetical protein WBK55_02560 [Alphaproteobacteria bacterium]